MKKSTWIVLSLVVVLGLIYASTRKEKVSVGVRKLDLPVLNKEQVNRIEIGGKEKILLNKENDSWLVLLKKDTEERKVSADKSHVEALLDAVAQIRHSYYVTEIPEKLEELGLSDDKKKVVTIYNGEQILWQLELGKNAEGGGIYAKLPNDNNVHVMRGSFYQLTRNNVNDWRNKALLSVPEEKLSGFELLNKTNVVQLSFEKAADEKALWDFAKNQPNIPKDFRKKDTAFSSIARAVSTLRASNFVDETLSLSEPDFTLNVKDKDGASSKLLFYGPKEDKYLVKKPEDAQVYEISKYSFDRINQPLESLRDLSVMKFNSSSIVKMTVYVGKEPVTVEKKEEIWELSSPKKLPEGFEFDKETVEGILSVLASLSAKRVAIDKKDMAKDPNWQKGLPKVLLVDKEGAKLELFITDSKADKNVVLALGNIDPNVYVLNRSDIEKFNKGIQAFKKEEFELPPIDERTKGFESLPVDVQRKLLESAKGKK